jgi:hypothetical protein
MTEGAIIDAGQCLQLVEADVSPNDAIAQPRPKAGVSKPVVEAKVAISLHL